MSFDFSGFLGKQIMGISREIENKNQDIFNLCYELNDLAQEAKYKFAIHTENGQEVVGASLFVKILQGFRRRYCYFGWV